MSLLAQARDRQGLDRVEFTGRGDLSASLAAVWTAGAAHAAGLNPAAPPRPAPTWRANCQKRLFPR